MRDAAGHGDSSHRKWWLETLRVWRFFVVGLVATFSHLSVALLLMSSLELNPLLANVLAFLTAFSLSFSGNYFWTFRHNESGPAIRLAMFQFLLVSASAFVVNNSALFALIILVGVEEHLAVLLSAMLVPAYTFILSRFWVFR
jgi:putative flippase GtrA